MRADGACGGAWRRACLALLACLALTGLCAGPQHATAADGDSLGDVHPGAAIFRQMARRGGMDYAVRTGQLPATLAQLEAGGYTAYMFAPAWQPLFEEHDGYLTLNSLGQPAYFAGAALNGYNVVVTLPEAEPYRDVVWPSPLLKPDGTHAADVTERQWSYPGAQWLTEGHGWPEVEAALRRERLAVHLNWLTYEYDHALGGMPQQLADLEGYLGTARNPAGWVGVSEVASLAEVAAQPGNLFTGWDHGAWVVSINLGPALSTARWVPDGQGHYTSGQGLAY